LVFKIIYLSGMGRYIYIYITQIGISHAAFKWWLLPFAKHGWNCGPTCRAVVEWFKWQSIFNQFQSLISRITQQIHESARHSCDLSREFVRKLLFDCERSVLYVRVCNLSDKIEYTKSSYLKGIFRFFFCFFLKK
jgi:hypothetical protein